MNAGRGPLAEALQLFALTGLAVAAPLFDLVGRHPEFLVAHALSPRDVVAWGIALLALPTAILWGLVRALARLHAGLARTLHLACVAVFAACFALPVARLASFAPGALVLATAAGIGGAVATAFARRAGVRVFVSALAVLPLGAALVFATRPGVAGLLREAPPAASAALDPAAAPPVAFLVLDELPTTSLLDASGRIDAVRYPSFARLSDEATFFPNTATVAASTTFAVPALLTGRSPRPGLLATGADHPGTLFSLLAGTYAMHVREVATFLYAGDPESDPRRGDPLLRGELLAADLGVLWLHALLPRDLARGLPEVTQAWRGFAHDAVPDRVKPRERYVDRALRAEDFAASIRACAEPCLYFQHVLLPHVPWQYTQTGAKYYPHATLGLRGERWPADPWWAEQGQQRHLVQLALVDRLLGAFLAALRDAGLYDDALVVVVADHGAAFWPGESRRDPDRTAHPEEILRVPFWVKAPGQRSGSVRERVVRTVDVLPTVADLLGAAIPWPVDGCSALRDDCPRPEVLAIHGARGDRFTFAAEVLGRRASLERKLALFGSGRDSLFRVGRYRDLVGRPAASLPRAARARQPVALHPYGLELAVERPEEFVHAFWIGRFHRRRAFPPDLHAAVVTDGTVRSVVPTFARGDQHRFAALVPADAAVSDLARAELLLVAGDPAAPRIHETELRVKGFDPKLELFGQPAN